MPARILKENAVVMRAKQLPKNRRFALIGWVICVVLDVRSLFANAETKKNIT
jgi:hypothetical protein